MKMVHVEKILTGLALFVLLGLAASEVDSWDLFWQLQSGKYIVQTKSFIYTDLFSIAAEVPRFEHCWLHDVIFYLVYVFKGYAGLSWLKGLLVTATALVLIAVARLRGASFVSILLISVPSVLVTWAAWQDRPQLWSFLLFSLFVYIFERFWREGGRIVWLLLPLMVFWSNLHAGAVLAFPLLLAWLVGDGLPLLVNKARMTAIRYRRLCLVGLLLGAATLVTPYGTYLMDVLGYAPKLGEASGSIAQIYNPDWHAVSLERAAPLFYALGISFLLLAFGWRRFALADFLLIAGLGFMAFRLERHGPFLLFAMAALLPAYADAAVKPILQKFNGRALPLARPMVLLLAIGVIIHFARPVYLGNGFFKSGFRSWLYPTAAVEFIKEQKLPAGIFNSYEWGGYLMWELYPDYLVFWDGRQDSMQHFGLGLLVMWGENWEAILAGHKVNTIVLQPLSDDDGGRYPLHEKLRSSPAWSLVLADESSLVFVRRSAVAQEWLQSHDLPKGQIDDSLLAAALLVSESKPWRYKAWWEMARVYMERKDYGRAYPALLQYLSRAPADKREPAAEIYYRVLAPKYEQSDSRGN